MCQDKTRPIESALPTYKSTKQKNVNTKACRFHFDSASSNLDPKSFWNPLFVQRIQHIPFQFNLINILPLCQQTALLFSMFIESMLFVFFLTFLF